MGCNLCSMLFSDYQLVKNYFTFLLKIIDKKFGVYMYLVYICCVNNLKQTKNEQI